MGERERTRYGSTWGKLLCIFALLVVSAYANIETTQYFVPPTYSTVGVKYLEQSNVVLIGAVSTGGNLLMMVPAGPWTSSVSNQSISVDFSPDLFVTSATEDLVYVFSKLDRRGAQILMNNFTLNLIDLTTTYGLESLVSVDFNDQDSSLVLGGFPPNGVGSVVVIISSNGTRVSTYFDSFQISCGFWDFSLGSGFYATRSNTSASLIRISYSTMAESGSLALNFANVTGVVHDPNRKTAFFFSAEAQLIKVGYDVLSVVEVVDLGTNGQDLRVGVLDTLRGRAYLGTSKETGVGGVFFNIKLDPSTKVDSVLFPFPGFSSASLALTNNLAFFGTQRTPQRGSAVYSFLLPLPCERNSSCSGRGTCVYGSCNCTATPDQNLFPNAIGYTGDICQDLRCRMDCNSPQGICNGETGNCICTARWAEPFCDIPRCPFNCNGNGVCDNSTFSCQCDLDWTGDDCSVPRPRPCNYLTSCSQCSARSDCGWCESTGTCVAGTIEGPLEGGCLLWSYKACPAQVMLAFGYIFSILGFMMLAIDAISLLSADLSHAPGSNDSRIRESWWRNQRSAKTWLMVDQLQFTAITAQFALKSPSIYHSFAATFRWIIFGFALPWSEDRSENYSSGRKLTSLIQWSKTTLSRPEEVLYGQLFWYVLLIGLLLLGFFAISLVCISNPGGRALMKNRLTYLLLRLLQLGYFPLAVTGFYSLTRGSAGPIIVGLIVLIGFNLVTPAALFLLLKKKRRESGGGTGLFDANFMKKFAPFYSPYYFRRYWFMFVVLLKKFGMGLFIGLLYRWEAAQTAILIAILVVYIIALVVIRPYLDPLQMVADVTCNIINIIVLALMFAFLEDLKISYNSQQVIGALVGALGLVAMIVCVASFIKSWLQLAGIHNFKQLIDRCRGRGRAATYDFSEIELHGTKTN